MTSDSKIIISLIVLFLVLELLPSANPNAICQKREINEMGTFNNWPQIQYPIYTEDSLIDEPVELNIRFSQCDSCNNSENIQSTLDKYVNYKVKRIVRMEVFDGGEIFYVVELIKSNFRYELLSMHQYYQIPKIIYETIAGIEWLNNLLSSVIVGGFVIRPVKYCLPESSDIYDEWESSYAKIGHTIVFQSFYLYEYVIHPRKMCIDDFGGRWVATIEDEIIHLYLCPIKSHDIAQVIDKLVKLSSKRGDIELIDLRLIDHIIQKVYDMKNVKWTVSDIGNVTMVLNNLIAIDRNTIHSWKLYEIMQHWGTWQFIVTEKLIEMSQANPTVGNISIITPNVHMHVLNPALDGVTGMAVYRATDLQDVTNDSSNYYYKFLKESQTIDGLLEDENLEVAAFVPKKLLELIKKDSKINFKMLRILISVLSNDQSLQARSVSRILSITIPGLAHLTGDIPMVFKVNNQTDSVSCGYWNISNDYIEGTPSWSSDGCRINRKKNKDPHSPFVICECNHFKTPSISFDKFGDSIYYRIIFELSGVLRTLSLVGIAGIILTALFYRSWRQKSGSKILIHLSFAIGLQVILSHPETQKFLRLLASKNGKSALKCEILGATVHFSTLSVLLWSFIVAYLQFMKYFVILHSCQISRLVLKASILGWIVPLIVVIFCGAFFPGSYSVENNCHPVGDLHDYAAFWPITIVTFINSFIFLLIVINIFSRRIFWFMRTKQQQQQRNIFPAFPEVRLTILLLFLLDVMAMFYFLLLSCKAHDIILKIFFFLANTSNELRGVVIFIYFIILDPSTRQLITGSLKKICCVRL